MKKLIFTDRIEKAEALWRKFIPSETVFDLWEIRLAFHRKFKRPMKFLYYPSENHEKFFLYLSFIEEENLWCFFPGETWSGKTWLEQNRLICDGFDRESLTSEISGNFHLKNILWSDKNSHLLHENAIRYTFHPPEHSFNTGRWIKLFRSKHARNLLRDIEDLKQNGAIIRSGNIKLFDLMTEMNIVRFGPMSYFADTRFREGFLEMIKILSVMGLLRTTAVEVKGLIAAVGFGAVYNGRYTILGGGTDMRFPSVAKMINMHHLQYACEAKLSEVDFLCGNFSWKTLFHLRPEPLYLFSSNI